MNSFFAKAALVLCALSLTVNSESLAKTVKTKTTSSSKVSKTLPKKEDQPTVKIEAARAVPAEELWRKVAPQLPLPRPFNMPKVESYKMDNGLEVMLLEDHRFPFASINLGFRTGTAQEPATSLGVAEMTAILMPQGTTTRTSKQIASQVEYIGGALKSSTDYDYSLLSGSCLSAYSDKLFDVMCDVLLNPSFPADELSLRKANQIQELTMKRSDPDFLIEERFSKVVFGSHPYSVVSPSEADINKLTSKDLAEYHDSHYLPNNAVLIVVGDFDSAKIKPLLESKLGSAKWKQGNVPVAAEPAMPAQSGRKIYLVDRPGSVQTSIKVGNVSIKRNDPSYFPMLVANQILGGTAHARLFLNIREAKGFTYGAYSKLASRKEPGAFFAEADVRTDVTNPSLQEFLYELDKMRTTKVKDDEIQAAKNYLAGSFQLGLETQGGIAQRLLEMKLFDLPNDYLETYANKVVAVSVDDVKKAASKLIDSNNLVVCVVGDANKIKEDLALFGPVNVYDSQGRLAPEQTVH